MRRLSTLFVLGGAGLLLTPLSSLAQFPVRAFGIPGGRPPLMVPIVPPVRLVPLVPIVRPVPLVPIIDPITGFPQFRASASSDLSFGNITLSTRQSFVGLSAWAFRPVAGPIYAYSGTYGGGGSAGDPDFLRKAYENLASAQRQATIEANILAVPSPTPVVAVPAKGGLPAGEVGQALAPAAPAEIASGEALNKVMREIVRAEEKVKKGTVTPSAYIPPQLLKDVRFAGLPSADLLNLARRAPLELPPAFDAPALMAPREELTNAFAAVVEPLRSKKDLDVARVARLEIAHQNLKNVAAPVLKGLPATDAANAQRFLDRMEGAVVALKTGNGSLKGLLDPNWDAEGLSGADLVRHMAKYKLQFGPVPRGEEQTYETVYKNLSAYLFALTQAPKKS
jgi:hypothetical protein